MEAGVGKGKMAVRSKRGEAETKGQGWVGSREKEQSGTLQLDWFVVFGPQCRWLLCPASSRKQAYCRWFYTRGRGGEERVPCSRSQRCGMLGFVPSLPDFASRDKSSEAKGDFSQKRKLHFNTEV